MPNIDFHSIQKPPFQSWVESCFKKWPNQMKWEYLILFHHLGVFLKICLKRNMIVTLLEKVKQLFSRWGGILYLQQHEMMFIM
ncbi:hypothetical protein BA70_05545 [Bacillus zhangzhouensis]|uniref:Uncharacterized protein n=1 Tax=Bacillus zhangzhouensis TaxID=1178540 RepID=A0A081L991_9BACI|nr:hypothetical protein BA70_05545 [Bacillus zhangzhouensis]